MNLFEKEIREEAEEYGENPLEEAGFSFDDSTGEIIEESATDRLEKELTLDFSTKATMKG